MGLLDKIAGFFAPAEKVRGDLAAPAPRCVLLEEDVPVKGISKRQKAANEFYLMKEHELRLRPYPGNPYDPNAMRVEGWLGPRKGWVQLGYLPKELAAEYAGETLLATMECIFPPGKDRSIGIRLRLWRGV